MQTRPIAAIFVSSNNALSPTSGGQQLCNREYRQTLEAAGFSLSVLAYDPDQRLVTKLLRRARPRPYSGHAPPGLTAQILEKVRVAGARSVFLYGVDLAPLAASLKRKLPPECSVVLLSAGLESVDYLHTIRAAYDGELSRAPAAALLRLGRQLAAECEQRRHIDHVICLAPFEVEIERWLGARSVDWLPRVVPYRPLAWRPDPSRIGFVGTLDHPPNLEGLQKFLEALRPVAPSGLRLRLVGGPAGVGERLKDRFGVIDYVGFLSDDELEREAATWACFVHPIFCYARGCSTKLAVALGWRIPVATTPAGCRGYTWRKGNLPLADTPQELASLALKMLDIGEAQAAAREVTAVADSAPTIAEVADKVRGRLLPARAST